MYHTEAINLGQPTEMGSADFEAGTIGREATYTGCGVGDPLSHSPSQPTPPPLTDRPPTPPPLTRTLEEIEATVPTELRVDKVWSIWEFTWDEGNKRWKKQPFFAASGSQIKFFPLAVTSLDRWVRFTSLRGFIEDGLLAGRHFGIGRLFTKGSGFVGIDLDGCLDADGNLVDWSVPIVGSLRGAYCEISPSGRGLKFWVRGSLAGKGRRLDWVGENGEKFAIEVYDDGRYFTVTGNAYWTPPEKIAALPEAIVAIYEMTAGATGKTDRAANGPTTSTTHQSVSVPLSDEDLIRKAGASKKGDEFIALYDRGDLSSHGNDPSRADLALTRMLAFWTSGDAVRIERMFGLSALGKRDKWVERADYREATIAKAIESTSDHYDPGFRSTGSASYQTADPASGGSGLRRIECSDVSLATVTEKALDALAKKNNPPEVFNFGGRLAWIKTDPDDGHAFISLMDRHEVRIQLATVASYVHTTESMKGNKTKEIFIPMDVVNSVMSVKTIPDRVAPPLDSVAESPRFASNGSLIDIPGYHASSRIFYQPPKTLDGLEIPETPSDFEVSAARSLLLDDYLIDFPFDGASSKANALACMILPFVRGMIDGATPLHVFEASTEGTGKGKLANACSYPSLGREIGSQVQKEDEAEWRKSFTSFQLSGLSHFFIDNMYNPLSWSGELRAIESGTLASYLTQDKWEDRILGGSKNASIKIRAVMMAAGNNLEWSKELARRIVPIRLRPAQENPSERTGFRCDPDTLEIWASKHRRELLVACLILCRHWIATGRKPGIQVMGSYESYAKVMGGILDSAGVDGFLGNLKVKVASTDRESIRWHALVERWSEVEPSKPVTSGEIYELIYGRDQKLDHSGCVVVSRLEPSEELQVVFADVLGDGSPLSRKQRLGHALQKQVDRVWSNHRIMTSSIKGKGGVPTFKLDQTTTGQS